MTYYIVFIYGLVWGSFLNVLALREWEAPDKRKHEARSSCDYCGYQLRIWDLVPVLSYCYLKGRCRSCHRRLSILYPLSELVLAFLFLYAYDRQGLSRAFLFEVVLWSLLLCFSLMDIYYFKVSNRLLLIFASLLIILTSISLNEAIIGGMIQVVVFSLAFYFSQGGLGMGDVKLMVVLGLVLGYFQSLLILAIASMVGVASFLCFKKSKLPFVPFIFLGTFLSFLLLTFFP